MAAPTYKATCTVLRKTKLGETDLILTMLAEDGSQLKAVAKGARKPGGAFAGRLELYNTADLMLAKGKSLDIIKEARTVTSNERLTTNIDISTAASVCAELAERISQVGLPAKQLFDMTHAALEVIASVDEEKAPLLACAYMLKCFAISGMRPNLDICGACGAKIFNGGSEDEATGNSFIEDASEQQVRFSYSDGGLLCSDCASFAETIRVDVQLVMWANWLLHSTFQDIVEQEIGKSQLYELLQMCQQWCAVHIGSPLRSLKFMLTLPPA